MEEVRRTVRIPADINEQLNKLAKAEDRAIAAVIRSALKEYVEKNGNKLK